jgi:hypothetical protein
MKAFLAGKGFTYAILGLYALRAGGYAVGGDWARVMYWLCAMGITVSAEFLIDR